MMRNVEAPGQVRLDVEYIERQPVWLDLVILVRVILVRTILAVIPGRGAS